MRKPHKYISGTVSSEPEFKLTVQSKLSFVLPGNHSKDLLHLNIIH